MRAIAVLSLACLLSQTGCADRVVSSQPGPDSAVDKDAEPARLFGIAENLEKAGKTKEAISTYRHIERDFPKSGHSKKARERTRRLPVGR